MFQGFNQSIIDYFLAVGQSNSRETFRKEEALYTEGIKQPLEELYCELAAFFSDYDQDLQRKKRSCISSAYNDARFCRGEPVKEYFYLRFRLNRTDRKNIPGFYLDASLTNFRYGLQIYELNAEGMEHIRRSLLADKKQAQKLIQSFCKNNTMEISGKKYKAAHYPEESALLRDWLERRRISFFHEEQMNQTFFERKLLDNMTVSFQGMKEIYLFLKNALI